MRERRTRVVILYAHPLLGEGVGHLLAGERALEVQSIRSDDAVAVERALAEAPDVVIFERSTPLQASDLLPFVPGALFIDVGLDAGPTWTYRREEISPRPEGLLRAIRRQRAHSAASPGGASPAEALKPASSGTVVRS